MGDVILEPGWLMQTCREASIRAKMDSSPSALRAYGFPANTPISDKEAAELFEIMDKRFRAWTGRSLIDQLNR